MKIVGIYSITNEINGFRYIGCSFDMSTRWQTHITDLTLGKCINVNLQSDFDKFNKDITKFKFEILEIVQDKNILFDKEQIYINKFYPKVYNVVKNPNLRIFRKYHVSKECEELAIKLMDLVRAMKHPVITIDIRNKNLLERLDCSFEDLQDMFNSISINGFERNGILLSIDGHSNILEGYFIVLGDYNRLHEMEYYLSSGEIPVYSDSQEIDVHVEYTNKDM